MAKVSAVYALANSANYKFDICKMGEHNYDPLAFYYKQDFPDVRMTRPSYETDFDLINRLCLVTVNGFIHRTVLSNGEFYIQNGSKSMLRSRTNSVGILSLAALSTNITRQDILPSMVFEDVGFPPSERVIITLPTAVETPMLVMAGYLILENPEHFFRISDTSFVLRLDRLMYMEKLYELSAQRDIFADLEVPVSAHNPTMVDGATIRSIGVIRKFLSLENSFIVDLHTEAVSARKIYMQHTNTLGSFRSSVKPTLPLFVGYGKLCEYKRVHDAVNRYTISTQDAYYSNHVFSQSVQKTLDVYNDHRIPGDTVRLASAFMLDIYKET